MTRRADKKKSIDKVTAAKAKNPLATEREIAKATGLGKSTVHRAMGEVGQTGAKDFRIQSLVEKDLEIIRLGQDEIARRLGDKEELDKMRTGEISQVIKENTARYTLFKGDATDDEGGLKSQVVTFNLPEKND